MRLSAAVALVLMALGCASAPTVIVMRMGPLYPAREGSCSLEFLNAQHVEIATGGYAQLGLVSFPGPPEEIAEASNRIPGAVAKAACEMGGTSVSLNAAMATTGASVIQFSVWHAPEKPEAKPGANASEI